MPDNIAANADAVRAQQNYELLKDDPAFNRFLDWGGAPTLEETGMSPEQYKAYIQALEYGRTQKSSFADDLQKALRERGAETDRYRSKGGEDTVEYKGGL